MAAAAIENRSRNRSTSHVVFLIWEDGTEKTFRHICPPARSLELRLQSTLETTPIPSPHFLTNAMLPSYWSRQLAGWGWGVMHRRLEIFVKLKVLKMWANCLKRDPLPPPVHLRKHRVVESLTAFHHWSRQDTGNFSLCSDLFICGEKNLWKHRTGCAEACFEHGGGTLTLWCRGWSGGWCAALCSWAGGEKKKRQKQESQQVDTKSSGCTSKSAGKIIKAFFKSVMRRGSSKD